MLTATQLTALTTEINTDPVPLGYAPHKASGDHQAIAALLNISRIGQNKNRKIINTRELIQGSVVSEIAALSATNRQLYQILIEAGELDLSNANVRGWITTIFPSGTTRTNLISLQTQQTSRAEVLFGDGMSVTPKDVARALGGG